MAKIDEQYLVVLAGPTAVGKTALAISLSQELNGVIISADSRQVYKEMSIGTAKPTPAEIKAGNICMVDHVSVTEPYSAGIYAREALAAIAEVLKQGQLPILVGGTGLYIKAVCEGLDYFPAVPDQIILEIEKALVAGKIETLLEEIKVIDPGMYEKMDVHNHHRIIRILSIIRSTGKPYSGFLNQNKEPRNFKPIYIVLELPREELYERINTRVEEMVELGLFAEVKSLTHLRNLKALNSVGYSEVFRYLDGALTREECISEIQKNSRRYAKRQMTWFRNQMNGQHISPYEYELVLEYLNSIIKAT